MAFIDIEDPIKREEIVQDYIKNIQEIRQRKENQKVHGMQERQNIEKAFQPVVQATEKSTKQITSEIKDLKEKAKKKPSKEPVSQALYYYSNQYDESKLDKYYGVYEEDDVYMMGEKEIKVDGYNNIHIDNTVLKGTPGLWRLIMMKKPEFYSEDEKRDYKELVDRTNVINFPHATKSSDRPTSTSKFTFLENLLKGQEEKENLEEEESEKDKKNLESEEESEEEDEADKKVGTGIYFLPGDINGLIRQLHLLLAEYRAGNKSATKTQIVAILDELLKRKYLNQDEYNGVCRALLC